MATTGILEAVSTPKGNGEQAAFQECLSALSGIFNKGCVINSKGPWGTPEQHKLKMSASDNTSVIQLDEAVLEVRF